MGSLQIVTSSLSLARQLWRYGESDLASRAFTLTPTEVADIGVRAGTLYGPKAEELWPDGPGRGGDRALMLAATEHLEGAPRPCARTRRLPEKSLPEALRATEGELWASVRPVSAVVDARKAGPHPEA